MAFGAHAPRAGLYAQARYRRGLRAWRSRTRLVLVACFGPFIVAGLAVLFVDGHVWSWIGGLACGVAMGVWLTLRESPPAYVENWQLGAEGERMTARALKPLERSGWRVVHDVQARYGNYDHIAVGYTGVFLLESKNLRGIVEVRDGVPYLRRRLDPQAETRYDRIRPRALAGAASLSREIQCRTGYGSWVQAVVVFWCEFPEQLVEDGRCVFVHGSRLAEWLDARPRAMDEVKAKEIPAAIDGSAKDAWLARNADARTRCKGTR